MLFSRELWEKEFASKINPYVEDVVNNGVDFGAEQLVSMGADFEIGKQQVLDFIDEYNVRLSKRLWPEVNQETYEQLRDTMKESVAADETAAELRKRIDVVFDNAVQYRSERIARSETVRAFNEGQIEGWRISDVVEGKEWLMEFDDRTCEFCVLMDGAVEELNSEYFAKDDSMDGAQNTLNFDYSSIESPPLHPNCRCTLLAVLK